MSLCHSSIHLRMLISLYLFIYIKFVNNLEILEITNCVAHGLYCI